MATLRQHIATNVLSVTRYRDLLRKVRSYRPAEDQAVVKKAYEFSEEHHKGQVRQSGEPYLVHPLEVAIVLADMRLDATAIAAGLLHDAVEDTTVTVEEIKAEFGEQVAHIVEGVTKISKIDFASSEEAQAENVRKMVLAMMDDIRVVLIKLADRLHNMRTLKYLSEERQQKISRETLDIYAPIAHRLGMGKIRGELEDLAFQYVDPADHNVGETVGGGGSHTLAVACHALAVVGGVPGLIDRGESGYADDRNHIGRGLEGKVVLESCGQWNGVWVIDDVKIRDHAEHTLGLLNPDLLGSDFLRPVGDVDHTGDCGDSKLAVGHNHVLARAERELRRGPVSKVFRRYRKVIRSRWELLEVKEPVVVRHQLNAVLEG